MCIFADVYQEKGKYTFFIARRQKMNLRIASDQGWSKHLDPDLRRLKPENQNPAADVSSTKALKLEDSFEKSSKAENHQLSSSNSNSSAALSVSYQFNLFYEMSSKVEARMGKAGAERFVETGATISETFKSSFSLEIDVVGSFIDSTDKSLDISPETTDRLFTSIQELSEMSIKSVENFLKATNEFFQEIEERFSSANGIFDDMRSQMESQARDFFDSFVSMVGRETQEVIESSPEVVPEQPETENQNSIHDSLLIQLQQRPGRRLPLPIYQDFLSSFHEYAQEFQTKMKEKFASEMVSNYGKKQAEANSQSLKTETIDISISQMFHSTARVFSPAQLEESSSI